MAGLSEYEGLIDMAITNLKRDKRLAPVVFLINEKTKPKSVSVVTIAGMTNDEQKDKIVEMIKTKIEETKSTAVLCIIEGWYLDGFNVKPDIGGNFMKPSNHPQRKECISVSYVNSQKKKDGRLIPFTRVNGKIVFLEEDKDMTGFSFGGRFTEWFD